MSKEHCLINGARCSKCCEVLSVLEDKSLREWQSYTRRYGYKNCDELLHQENRIHHLLIKISKRRAKKINPHLVKLAGNKQSYFLCRNFNGVGCSDYENRPGMCSQYPHYGKSNEEMRKTQVPLYKIDCTYFTE